MTSRKHWRAAAYSLFCNAHTASVRLNLGDFLRFGRGEEKSGGRRKDALLADVLEAITGAIFLDGGLNAATAFVLHALGNELDCVNPVDAAQADFKTILQEKLQAEHRPGPRYTVVETVGPPHSRTFHVELVWDGGTVRGEGRSIKVAEAAAARRAIESINEKKMLDVGREMSEESASPAADT